MRTDFRPSMRVREKALDLVRDGGIVEVPGTQYRVKSGDNEYMVLWSLNPVCTCVASGYCSHIEAVRVFISRKVMAA